MDKSEKFWNKSANGYDKEEMKDKEVRAKILERTRKYLKKKQDVLDFGCATGILSNEIAGDVNMVYGIDISAEMIKIAQSKARARNIQNVEYSHSTIFDGKYKAGSFDVILGVYMLHLLDDMPAALKRIHELLKPGGCFISVTPCLENSFAGMALSLVSKIGLIPSLSLLSVAELESFINKAGFKINEAACLQKTGRQHFIVAQKQ